MYPMLKKIVPLIAIILLIGCKTGTPPPSNSNINSNNEQESQADTAETTDTPATTTTTTQTPEPKATTASFTSDAPIYTSYSSSTASQYDDQKPYAIFFHAPWCPTCGILDQEINANLSSLPNGTKILKADYDSETALKSKYGVKIQSTVVLINADGQVTATLPYTNFGAVSQALRTQLQ